MSKQPLKNTTVRLEQDFFELIQGLAQAQGRAPSDLIREALRTYIALRTKEDPECDGKVIADFYEAQLEAQSERLRRRYGVPDPDDSPGRAPSVAEREK